MLEYLDMVFGIGEEGLTWWQMAIRAVVVFFVALIIVRMGNHRIFGKQTAFDIVLGIMYGSILSRAITGNSPFVPTLVAAFMLVLLHKGLAWLAFRSNFGFGDFIKGEPEILIKNGEVQHKALSKNSITRNDLEEALRKAGSDADLKVIEAAYLERSGEISIILKDDDKE